MDRAVTQIRKASESEPETSLGAESEGTTKMPEEQRSALAMASDTVGFWERGPKSHVLLVHYIRSAVEARDAIHSALLAEALDMLAKLLPYAGESYDSMTNAQAKHCEETVEQVGEFLHGK